MKIEIDRKYADKLEELFENGHLITERREIPQNLGKALREIRDEVIFGYDRKNGKSLVFLDSRRELRKKKNYWSKSVFEIF